MNDLESHKILCHDLVGLESLNVLTFNGCYLASLLSTD